MFDFIFLKLISFFRTPLHVDDFTSYSWSANIVGKKRWLLFSPGKEQYLKHTNGDLVYDIKDNNLNEIMNYDSSESFQALEIIQDTGQIVFIPSGLIHQVWNLVN